MDAGHLVTRRTALRLAAGAGVTAAASGGLPAWARPIAAATARKGPGSRPYPGRPEGAVSMPQIEHVVILMLENHSFDNVLGMLPHRSRARRHVDGLAVDRRGRVRASNPDLTGRRVFATHASTPCQRHALPRQDWKASHVALAGGRNDGFVRASGPVAMRFYDKSDLPFTYALAERFPIGERYFQSCLAQTYPNRRFLCGHRERHDRH